MLLAVSHKTKNLDSKGENNAGDFAPLGWTKVAALKSEFFGRS